MLAHGTIVDAGILEEICGFFEPHKEILLDYFIQSVQAIEVEEEAIDIEGHSRALIDLAADFGKILKLPDIARRNLLMATECHDIGKLPIPKNILLKPGKLTNEEFEFVKIHPKIGYIIMLAVGEKEVAEIVLFHHERWDGKGYPYGVAGDDIPLLSRVISIIDAYDAMTCRRIYRTPLSPEDALREVQRNAGTQFDRDLVDLFCEIWIKKYGDHI